jgi:hypothetical protein
MIVVVSSFLFIFFSTNHQQRASDKHREKATKFASSAVSNIAVFGKMNALHNIFFKRFKVKNFVHSSSKDEK